MQNTNQQPIILTDFMGQSENPSVGAGVSVGLDLFTTKTVARLSRKMNKQSGTLVTHLPIACTIDNSGKIYVQDEQGNVYKSIDNGVTWTSLLTAVSGGTGLMVWEDFLFSFSADNISIYGPLSGSPSLTTNWWTTTATQSALQNAANINHYPFVYGQVMYFCNGQYIGYIEKISDPGAPFNPLVAPGTTYLASPTKFTLSNFYIAQSIGLLPPQTFGIAVSNAVQPSSADVVIWDGVSTSQYVNIVTLPGAANPVKQLITKNGILYGITDKEHAAYVINGYSAQLVDRLALRMSNRSSGGTQYTTRLASSLYPSGVDFLGPELLTGGSNFPSPVTQIAGTGLYPYGVWSLNIENQVIGTRFPLSHGSINATYGTDHAIGFVKVLSNNAVLVGWQRSNVYGIDLLDSQNYITDPATTFLESSLYLAGTRLVPRTFSTFEFNLIAPLNAGEEIQFYWRTSPAEDYTSFGSIGQFTQASMTDQNGVNLSGTIQQLPFQNVKYIQIGAQINSGNANNLTPQFRDAILK